MAKQQSARGKSLSGSTEFMLSQHLWLKILIGMGLGMLVGYIVSPEGLALFTDPEIAYSLGSWIKLPGVIFLALIQMVIIPLVVCSIILGIADSGSIKQVKKLGLRIIPYFIATTAIAITIGIVLVQWVAPGADFDQNLVQATMESGAGSDRLAARTFTELTIPDRIANLIPTNPAQAELDRNMLQIVIASILVGIALLGVPKTGKPFRDLCIAGQTISMKIISWAMMIAPYAVFGLIGNVVIRTGADALANVGLYMMTVLAALLIMMIVYMLIARVIGGYKIKDFLAGVREAQFIAFSTSSSAATMPVSIQCAEEKLNIREDISRFVIPLGATINMDGTALYQAVAALFLCQVFQVDLSFGEIILLLVTTVGASIGTPATPGVGIVVLATILVGIGVPAEGIALIIGVDRILDMCRTTVNVTGDLTAATVMQKWLPKATK